MFFADAKHYGELFSILSPLNQLLEWRERTQILHESFALEDLSRYLSASATKAVAISFQCRTKSLITDSHVRTEKQWSRARADQKRDQYQFQNQKVSSKRRLQEPDVCAEISADGERWQTSFPIA